MDVSELPVSDRKAGSGSASAGSRTTILFVLASNAVGGAEIQTRALLEGLSRRFRIALLTHGALERLFEGLDVEIVRFEDYGLSNPWDYSRGGFRAYGKSIADAARRTEADIVYGVMHNASLFLAVARWRHLRTFWGRKLLGSLHGSLHGYFEQRGSGPSPMERFLIRLALVSLQRVVTPSRGVASELVTRFGARPDRVRPVYNGFDLERIRTAGRQLPALEKTAPWVLTCCRLSDQKDFKTLIRAFAQVRVDPLPQLVVVGEGEMRDATLAWARKEGVAERLHLVGFQDNPFAWIRQADVFVLSSFYEGFGNVIVEAMALGVPVVASDCPWGPAEIIEAGRSGEIFPIADDRALAALLTRLLTDPRYRERLAEAAVARAEDFSIENMTEGYSKVFGEVAVGAASRRPA